MVHRRPGINQPLDCLSEIQLPPSTDSPCRQAVVNDQFLSPADTPYMSGMMQNSVKIFACSCNRTTVVINVGWNHWFNRQDSN